VSTVTPSPEQGGAVRATPPPQRSRMPLLLLLGLFAAVIIAGVLYLLLHDGNNKEPASRRVADTGTLPASAAPSNALPPSPVPAVTSGAGGTAPGTAASTPAPASSSATSPSPVVGWVGGAGLAPAHATGGLAAEGSIGTVLFPYNSSSLDADAKQVIVAVAADLRKQKPSSVRVTGYTDNVGTPGYNLALSQRRAKAVADLLNTQLPPGWVVSTGKGWADPVAPNTNDDNRSKNRRTTITVT
jgi:outer membrane protein OmpA-like peptidoglycan-associated protein